VRSYLNNQRQGTSKVKSRGEVRCSTRKKGPQKGSGNARHGAASAPNFVGGGIAFGPTGKENYHCKINKKVKKKALQSILSKKNEEQKIMVIKQINLPNHKTKEANKFLTQLKVNDKKILIIFSAQESQNEEVKRAFRNLPKVKLSNSKLVNVYEIMNHSSIFFTQEALSEMERRLKNE
jgi:large subunit ribosomal protein L4